MVETMHTRVRVCYATQTAHQMIFTQIVNNEQELDFVETEVPHLNLLGRSAIRQLDISVDKLVKHVNVIKSDKTQMSGVKSSHL